MPFTGEWYHQSQRPILKTGRGVTADVEQTDVASCAVTSEGATSILRSRSITVIVEKPTASSSEGWSSSYVAWRPLINVNVLRVQHVALGVHENATCDNYTIYGNAGTCISQIALKAVSTAIAAGTRTAGAAITQAALAACTDVLIKLFGSTCSMPARAAFQIDYESSG